MKMISVDIGVDIGGTHTDAVLVDESHCILARVKVPTTERIEEGFSTAIRRLLQDQSEKDVRVRGIVVGTTHAINAILQRRKLYKVGVVRLAGQGDLAIPPAYDWPEDLRQAVFVGSASVPGGYECDRRPIKQIDAEVVREAAKKLFDEGAESLAIVGVFSPLCGEQELMVKEIICEMFGDDFSIPITLSHQMGGMGLLERENSTILNCALKKVAANGFESLLQEVRAQERDFSCPVFITQNNGSIVDLSQAVKNPILTISSGASNSFVGGARLAGCSDAIVVDIGGTSTDVGIVRNGFLRKSLHASYIGGVKIGSAMPDVLSVAMGGGSCVEIDNDNEVHVGPQSVARRLLQEGIAFGGSQLTLTDIGIFLGHLRIPGGERKNILLQEGQACQVMGQVVNQMQCLVDQIEPREKDLPVVVVGGGASLLSQKDLPSRYLVPKDAAVANAFGAALSEIAGDIDVVVSLHSREECLERLKGEVKAIAIDRGACPEKTRVVDVQIIPYHYMHGHMARVMMAASGPK